MVDLAFKTWYNDNTNFEKGIQYECSRILSQIYQCGC